MKLTTGHVKTLEPPDSHYLAAAEGWAELLAYDEAAGELSKIRPALLEHPDVLEVRWILAANANQWSVALSIAKNLARLDPERPSGWCCQADCLIELKRTAEAYPILLEGQKRFPEDDVIAYDLACICCALELTRESVQWIGKSIELGGSATKRRAMADPNLRPIWEVLHG